MSLNQIELVGVKVRVEGVEGECFWVNLREDNKVSEFHNAEAEYKMPVSEYNIAKFKMAVINKLSEYEWVKVFLCKWWEPILASVSGFERKNWDSWIQDGQIEDGCPHQVEWEWMSLRQIKLLWVIFRVEWECFWVNLREENEVSEFHNVEAESKMAEFKMATIIKLSQNEWVKFFCTNGGEGSVSEVFFFFFVQMVETNLGRC